jgi:hypothetical protein
MNPPRKAGKIEPHQAIDGGGIEGWVEVEMNFFA